MIDVIVIITFMLCLGLYFGICSVTKVLKEILAELWRMRGALDSVAKR